jgi:hypothetical protein
MFEKRSGACQACQILTIAEHPRRYVTSAFDNPRTFESLLCSLTNKAGFGNVVRDECIFSSGNIGVPSQLDCLYASAIDSLLPFPLLPLFLGLIVPLDDTGFIKWLLIVRLIHLRCVSYRDFTGLIGRLPAKTRIHVRYNHQPRCLYKASLLLVYTVLDQALHMYKLLRLGASQESLALRPSPSIA